MPNKVFSLPIKKYNVVQNNDAFLSVRLQAIKEGLNLNGSSFLLDGMERDKDSFKQKPILCAFPYNYQTGKRKIGDGHNSEVEYDDENDVLSYTYLDGNSERCVGYIPESSNIQIENIAGENWITLDAILWKQYYPELTKELLKKRNKNLTNKISVEVSVDSYMQDDIEIIRGFEGDGITILATDDSILEGIPGANLKVYSQSDKYSKFTKALTFALQNSQGDDNIKKFSVNDDELGKSPSIKIKNDKNSAVMSGTWSKPGASFLNKLLKASNHSSLINEAYLVADGGSDSNLSVGDVHYPHHSIKNDSLVVNARGCQSALSRGIAQGNLSSSEKSHLKKHYKELGLNMNNFKQFGLSKTEYSFLYKEEEDNLKEFINKAKENGYSLIGIKDSKVLFLKTKVFEAENDIDSDDMCKMTVYEVPVDDTDDEKEFDEKEFKESDLKMSDANDGDEDDKEEFEKLKASYEELKEKCEKLESVSTDFEAKEKELNEAKETLEKEKNEFEEKKAEEEKVKKEAEAKELEAETEKMMEDKEFGLDEDVVKELRQMRTENKFTSIEDFVKEVGYRKEKRRVSNPKKPTSFSYNYTPVHSNVNSSENTEDIDKIIKKYS